MVCRDHSRIAMQSDILGANVLCIRNMLTSGDRQKRFMFCAGLVVDDTIHFLHHFKKAYDETQCVESAVRETLNTTGRALVITSLVLSSGF